MKDAAQITKNVSFRILDVRSDLLQVKFKQLYQNYDSSKLRQVLL